ncbi:major facilitator superfamily domain-containing protein [Lentinula edodes]|uniref:major facilitator superfamily domain-containing protein n=1 Tax=Lentinula edodes TaxID=5353 RepID=UPI001E8D59D1|nr:major facilitator superfamily domain-containing protein [Lentinula edodes]KAH7877121.1 major facilitator superfamily domain-containing protein [Lentinula edodes]
MDHPVELRIPVEPISLHAQRDLLDGPSQDATNASNSEERFSVLELPPVDEGFKAWLFCASACALETFIWGWNNSYGIFQEFYSTHTPFQSSSLVSISAIGTASLAIQYIEIIAVIAVCQRYPEKVKPTMWIALLICVTTLTISSFASQVWQLIVLQGIIFGLAAGVLYAPIIMWLSEWFVRRRGLAGGIIFGGAGVGGFVFPLAIGACLDNIGFRWTMRIWAVILGLSCSLALFGSNPRVPVQRLGTNRPKSLWPAGMTDSKALDKLATNIFQALGFFPVSIFISTYTSALTTVTLSPTVVLALFNASSVVCYILFGQICDSYPYATVILCSGLGSALGAFFLWGFATNLGLVFAFALVFGGLSGGFPGIWPAAATEIAGSRDEHTSLAFGAFGVAKGIAAIVGPIIAASLHDKNKYGLAKYGAYGFLKVEIFVGVMAITTVFCAIAVAFISRAKHRA